MSAPQLTDPGTSSEWFRAVEDPARAHTAARRQRFQRLVTYTMVGLSAFAVLGLVCFGWRQHSLKAALEAPAPPAALSPVVAQPAAPPAAAEASLEAAPVAEPASPPLAALAAPAALKSKALSRNKASVKKPTASPFLRSIKPAAKADVHSAPTRPR